MKKIIIFAIIVIIIVLFVVARNMFFPADWAVVTVRGLPPDVQEFYMVAERGGKISAMNWYISKGLKHPMSPKFCNPQWRKTTDGSFIADIQWDASSLHALYRKKATVGDAYPVR